MAYCHRLSHQLCYIRSSGRTVRETEDLGPPAEESCSGHGELHSYSPHPISAPLCPPLTTSQLPLSALAFSLFLHWPKVLTLPHLRRPPFCFGVLALPSLARSPYPPPSEVRGPQMVPVRVPVPLVALLLFCGQPVCFVREF